MKVTVIIPGYRTEFIDETLYSVQRQNIPAHEIIYLHCKESTAAEKINQAAKIATGDALIVLSDDDIITVDFIEKTAKIMDGGWDIVYTDMLKFGRGMDTFVQPASDYNLENFKRSTVPWMTSLIRKSTFEEAGGWDPDQKYQDYDFYFRCFKNGARGYHLKEPLFEYRIHQRSGTYTMDHQEARRLMKNKHPEIL